MGALTSLVIGGGQGAGRRSAEDPRSWSPEELARRGVPEGWYVTPKGRLRPLRGHQRAGGREAGQRPRRERYYRRRTRVARPVQAGWRSVVERTADVLDVVHGAPDLAQSLRQCGRLAWVRSCGACGDAAASVRVRAHCDVRCCPFCMRLRARELVRDLTAAAPIAAGLSEGEPGAVRAEPHAARLRARVERARASVSHWEGRCERAALGGREASHARAQLGAALGRLRREEHRARRFLGLLGRRRSWGWRLVTVSPPWPTGSEHACTSLGLAMRVEDVRARWRKVWELLGVEGMGAAYTSVELSDHGHVHLHAVVFGPYVARPLLQRAAGVEFVDVRALKVPPGVSIADATAAAMREAAKYALKSPSPLRGDWIAGDDRRSCVHPELAAAWVIATRGRRLTEPYGLMREALGVVRERTDEDEHQHEEPRCGSCGSTDLGAELLVATARVARALGPEAWRRAWRSQPSTEHQRAFLGAGARIPPRVAVERGPR